MPLSESQNQSAFRKCCAINIKQPPNSPPPISFTTQNSTNERVQHFVIKFLADWFRNEKIVHTKQENPSESRHKHCPNLKIMSTRTQQDGHIQSNVTFPFDISTLRSVHIFPYINGEHSTHHSLTSFQIMCSSSILPSTPLCTYKSSAGHYKHS